MIRRTFAWIGLLSAVALAAAPVNKDWIADRARLRIERATLRANAEKDRQQRANFAAETIGKLVDRAVEQPIYGQKEDLFQLLAGLRKLDGAKADALAERIKQLPETPEAGAKNPAAVSWNSLLAQKKSALVARPGDLLNRSVKFGVVDLTYDFLREVLAFDPDQPSIRKALGQIKIKDQWVTQFMAMQLQNGLLWDEKRGWIIAKEQARYDKGEIYDFPAKKWLPLKEADELHSDTRKPWVIQSAHFEVRCTADLPTAAKAIDNLEAFYAQIFAIYATFFAKGGPADYKTILGLTEHPRLVVNIVRSKDQFRSMVPDSPEWAAGVFVPGKQASFFYTKPSGGNIQQILFHEITHHILHTFTGGNHSPSWLTEGIASYTQNAQFENGQLIVGSRLARKKSDLPLADLLAVDSGDKWAKTPQYAAAGSLVFFCMEGAERKYREDFVDFLRDSYRGTTGGRKLWDYLGMKYSDFETAYAAWQNGDKTTETQ